MGDTGPSDDDVINAAVRAIDAIPIQRLCSVVRWYRRRKGFLVRSSLEMDGDIGTMIGARSRKRRR